MKTILIIFMCITLVIGFGGCQTPQQQYSEQVSQGVYAVNDNMHVGRFDQAQKYSDDLIKTVAPPKHRIPVQAFNVPAP